MDERCLPPTHAMVRKMSDILLHERNGGYVSERWITRFIKQHHELNPSILASMVINAQNVRIVRSSTAL
jgi:hypothetical protein